MRLRKSSLETEGIGCPRAGNLSPETEEKVFQGRQGGRGLQPFTVADVEKEMPTHADMLCDGVDRAELALCPVLSVAERL